ncbi:MAG: four helix bundle protein [Microcoleaceae cyanobacterium MO_207.B10]|nr:four helix bundle protein [Microcoleaceae cyanobacterium MO_207.B10]
MGRYLIHPISPYSPTPLLPYSPTPTLIDPFRGSIAGSLKELETHLLICGRLTYLDNSELHTILELTSEVGKMLKSLMEKLKIRW